jgi:tRNA-binding EMAP/Myf-like protein
MSDLEITAADVALVRGDENNIFVAPAAAAFNAGAVVQLNSSGNWAVLDTTTGSGTTLNVGVAIRTATYAGEAVTCATNGAIVDIGDALDALAFGAPVYASETAGAMADAVSATASAANLRIGVVVPGRASPTADKLLRVDVGEIAIVSGG